MILKTGKTFKRKFTVITCFPPLLPICSPSSGKRSTDLGVLMHVGQTEVSVC